MAERKNTQPKFDMDAKIKEFTELDDKASVQYQVYRKLRKDANTVRDELVKNGWVAPKKTGETVPLKSQAFMQEAMNRRHKMSAVQVTALIAISTAPRPLTNNEVAHMLEPYVKFNSKDGDKSGGILRTLLLTLERNQALKTSYSGRTVVFGPSEHTHKLVEHVLDDLKTFGIEAFSKHENVIGIIDVKDAKQRLAAFEKAEAEKAAAKAKKQTAAAAATTTTEGKPEDENDIGL